MSGDKLDGAKRLLGAELASEVVSGMVLGVGTGSTAARAIESIGRRIVDDGLSVKGVPTSQSAERLCRAVGIDIVSLDGVARLDLAFDGADEVDEDLRLIKGRGAAHSREKVVASAADRFVVLADYTKRTQKLGARMPVPVEIIPMAVGPVQRVIESLGARAEVRQGTGKDGPTVTDQSLWIIDAHFDVIADPERVNAVLLQTPGVLDHGLFLNLATEVWFGEADGTITRVARRDD